MARVGKPVEIPKFSGDWDEQCKKETEWFNDFYEKNRVIKFGVADGYAYYQVTGNKRLTLHHVPVFDGYMAHPALLRGLTNVEIDYQLYDEEKLMEAFTNRSITWDGPSRKAVNK